MSSKVSIITPVYNRAALLKETIKSVIDQSFADWELLIVDDGSTDETKQVVTAFHQHDDRVKWISEPSKVKGAPASRNLGIERSAGSLLVFLDSDDLLLPSALEQRVQVMNSHPHLQFAVFPSLFFRKEIGDTLTWWNRFSDRNDLERFLLQDSVWTIMGPVWRKDFIQKKNLRFNEKAQSAQDWEFHINALLSKPVYLKFFNMPDNFVRRDDLLNKISSTHNNEEKVLNRIEVIRDLIPKVEAAGFNHYSPALCLKLMGEYNVLLNAGQTINVKNLVNTCEIFAKKNWPLQKLMLYLKTGSKLNSINFQLFRTFRRMFSNLLLQKNIYPPSLYQSPVSIEEEKLVREIIQSASKSVGSA